jgi:two-component system cell cycle sensor histidine kinase/response regulator CckA
MFGFDGFLKRRGRRKKEAHDARNLEALGLFAGGIAHDFNNILSIIEGYAAIAQRQQREEGDIDPVLLQRIVAATQRGAGLTRQLLAFGKQQVAPQERTNLSAELRTQVELLRPLLGKNISLSLALPKEPLWIMGVRDNITQIAINLALNARDALPLGGTMMISALALPEARLVPRLLREQSPPGTRFVHMRFSDDGRGIDDDVLPHVFDPFFTTKDQGTGTGLGLSVVYGIVEQMGGSIEVHSRRGKGTTFDIFLPLLEDRAAEQALPDAAQPEKPAEAQAPARKEQDVFSTLAGRTIMIAEDEAELRDVLTLIFSDMDMHVLTASNGNHALQMQGEYEGHIDFLLTDVVMPEMDGVELGERFRRERPQSNVVFMSGYPFMDNRKNIALPAEADFISKPLQEKRIREILERALARRDARLADDKKHGDGTPPARTETGFDGQE